MFFIWVKVHEVIGNGYLCIDLGLESFDRGKGARCDSLGFEIVFSRWNCIAAMGSYDMHQS